MLQSILPTALPALRDSGAQVIDVRGGDEWEQGHIEGATLVPLMVLPFKIQEIIPDRATPIIVYCRTGNRSAHAAHALAELGYTSISNLEGGFVAYQEAFPTSR